MFCSLYTMTYRTTWCILPLTLLSLSWLLLFSRWVGGYSSPSGGGGCYPTLSTIGELWRSLRWGRGGMPPHTLSPMASWRSLSSGGCATTRFLPWASWRSLSWGEGVLPHAFSRRRAVAITKLGGGGALLPHALPHLRASDR